MYITIGYVYNFIYKATVKLYRQNETKTNNMTAITLGLTMNGNKIVNKKKIA